eukprot:gene16004-21209_t
MVRLLRAGEPIKMSKRAGNFVTLADVVREVGKDVVRFTMLTRKSDAQMDFDFAKVVEFSRDNPVFYVQYAHARIKRLHRKAHEAGMQCLTVDLSQLDTRELELVKLAAQFPRIVETAATAREPHRIAFYLNDLAAEFHALYNLGNDQPERRFVIEGDSTITCGRGDELMATSGGDYEVRDEDRLPWLETVDEDYSDGPSIGRVILLVVIGLAVIAAAIFGFYWFKSHRVTDGNGALIAAQEGDYKV